MRSLTKHVFLSARECLRQGWYHYNTSSSERTSVADQFRLEQGQLVGQQARLLYPHGVLVDQRRPSDAIKQTAALLTNPKIHTIFEATFRWSDCTARGDLLVRRQKGWIVQEVKSALDGTSQIDKLTDDLTYTVMVAQGSGLMVEGCCLLLLSRDYRLGKPPSHIFVETNATEVVKARLTEFVASLGPIKAALHQSAPPPARLIGPCRDCEFFATKCIGHNLQSPITEIPRLHKNRLAQLVEMGIVDIRSIPDGFPLSPTQRITIESVKTGHEYVGPALVGDLARVRWPAAYLDFETVMTAIPLYRGVAPFEQIVTQFSVHICDEPGHFVAHHEYLADPASDGRRELAAELLNAVHGTASVIVYHAAFERDRLSDLAKLYDDLAPQLHDVIGRLYDLEVVIRRGYYHPDFRGRYSIKRVLPVLVPDLSYKGLAIGDGGMAVVKFAKMAFRHYDAKEAAEIRQQLLDYCELDTYAMVRLHQRLLELTEVT